MFIDKTTQSLRQSRFIGGRIVELLTELYSRIKRVRSINIAPLCGFLTTIKSLACPGTRLASASLLVALLIGMNSWAIAQNPAPSAETLKKTNARPADSARPKPEP